MMKFLSVTILLSIILCIKADTANQSPPVKNDTPQASYVPSAPTYHSNSDTVVLNNQAYDPNLYSTFVPQDAVQQYVSQYGNGYSGQAAALEGFLIPTFDRSEYLPAATPTFISILKSFLPGPKILIAILAKIVGLVASAVGIIFFGTAITSFVCAFTPLCTITILGHPLAKLRKETKDIVEKIGEEITAERVKRAADLFRLAIDKYTKMQQ